MGASQSPSNIAIHPNVPDLHCRGVSGVAEFREDEESQPEAMEAMAEDVAELVALSPSIRCVVLNACFSESVAKLIAPHVEAVIGCDSAIGDDAAIVLTRAFHRALSHGRDFVAACKLAKLDVRMSGKVAEGRKYVILSGQSQPVRMRPGG